MGKAQTENNISERSTIPISTLVLGAIILIILGILFVNNYNFSTQDSTLNYRESVKDSLNNEPTLTKEKCILVDVPYDDVEYYSEKEPYQKEECKNRLYAYAIEDFQVRYVDRNCNWMGLNCDHYAICSLTIKNHENQQGIFSLDMTFRSNTRGNTDAGAKSISIYAQSQNSLSWEYFKQTEEEVSCSYQTNNVPQRQECQWITTYKDVQKTRTVTKWKKEEQCT